MKRRNFIKLACSTIAASIIPFNIFKEKIIEIPVTNVDYFLPNELWQNTRTGELIKITEINGKMKVQRQMNDLLKI